MMEEQLRQFLREQGWTLYKRRRGKQEFYYALKWKQGERYITAASKLSRLTREKVLEKIQS